MKKFLCSVILLSLCSIDSWAQIQTIKKASGITSTNYSDVLSNIRHYNLLQKFLPALDQGIFRFDNYGTNDTFWLMTSLGRNLYSCFEFKRLLAGATNVHELNSAVVGYMTQILDDTSATFTYNGAGWTTVANSGTWYGSYQHNSTQTRTITWTTPANTMGVGVKAYLASNGGVARVTIDGTTNANMLLTAQAMVDAGTLANTVLVANGGILDPADRLFECYAATGVEQDIMFATNLAAAAHTMSVYVTGYKRAASSSTRVYFSAGLHAVTNQVITTNSYFTVLNSLDYVNNNLQSAWEYAAQLKPSGASAFQWVGNWHGNDFETNLVISVDGVDVSTMTNTVCKPSTNSVLITRTSELRHPEINAGTTAIGRSTTTYTLTPGNGLQVDWTITPLTTGTASTFYSAMMPTGLTKGSTLMWPLDITLSADNNSVNANSITDSAYLWNAGATGCLMYCPNFYASVNNFANTLGVYMWLEDRSGGTINKAYLTRVDQNSTITYNPSQIFTGSIVYLLQNFPSGAEASLSKNTLAKSF